jgi:ATP-dependent DNA helicase HFM1/MER3
MKSDVSCVISSPTASGKTVCFELAIVRLLTQVAPAQRLSKKIVYVAPIKALVHERAQDWAMKFHPLGLRCMELTGDSEEANGTAIVNADIMSVLDFTPNCCITLH